MPCVGANAANTVRPDPEGARCRASMGRVIGKAGRTATLVAHDVSLAGGLTGDDAASWTPLNVQAAPSRSVAHRANRSVCRAGHDPSHRRAGRTVPRWARLSFEESGHRPIGSVISPVMVPAGSWRWLARRPQWRRRARAARGTVRSGGKIARLMTNGFGLATRRPAPVERRTASKLDARPGPSTILRRMTCSSVTADGVRSRVPFVSELVPQIDADGIVLTHARITVCSDDPVSGDDDFVGAEVRIDVATVFPNYLAPVHQSVVGRAVGAGIIDFALTHAIPRNQPHCVSSAPLEGQPRHGDCRQNPAQATLDRAGCGTIRLWWCHRLGRPFTQLDHRAPHAARISPSSPVGANQKAMHQTAQVCEHYRAGGIRIEAVSIGDYVLAGGGGRPPWRSYRGRPDCRQSAGESSGVRRPTIRSEPDQAVRARRPSCYVPVRRWRGLAVPEVLLSGDRAGSRQWRRDQSRSVPARIAPAWLPDPAGRSRRVLACAAAVRSILRGRDKIAPATPRSRTTARPWESAEPVRTGRACGACRAARH